MSQLTDYWAWAYEKTHGTRYVWERKDAVLLQKLLTDYGKDSVRWCVREFMQSFADDSFVAERGWDVGALKMKYRGLHLRWVKLEEKRVLEEQRQQQAELGRLARDADVISLVDRVGRKA